MEKRFKIEKMTEGDGYAAIWQVSGDVKTEDLNDAVYAVMCEVGQDVLSQSVCRLSGERTAVELAGRIANCITMFDVPETMAPVVCINVGRISTGYKEYRPMFTCSFRADTVFEQIAEQEGVMNMAPKNYRRFKCKAADDTDTSGTMVPYKRCHGYHPRTISYKADHDRINKKFETLGKLYRSLTGDGMRKAINVVYAAHKWDKADFTVRDMAKWAMLWKLQRDYGREPEARPVYFVGSDFKDGPEIWKDADQTYCNILVRHFEQMLLDAPKPSWPVHGDIVTIKESARRLKKHEGKHLVDSVSPRLSADGRRIEWTVAVSVGRFDCEHFLPEQLEAAEDKKPKKAASKRGKSDARISSSEREQARHDSGKKTTKTTSKAKPSASMAAPTPEPVAVTLSLEERLRQALTARLAA